MTIKNGILLGAVGVGALWAGTAFLQLPQVEGALETAAAELLADPVHTGAFAEVQVSFSGQEAKLTGKVATVEERGLAAKRVAEDVRLGSGLNPVIVVDNEIEVDRNRARLYPKPWVVAYRMPSANVVGGTLKDDKAVESVAAALAEANPISEWDVKSVRSVEGARPAVDWLGTLANAPSLVPADEQGDAVAVSAGDGKWTLFPATATDDEVAAPLTAIGVNRLELAAELIELRQWQTPEPAAEEKPVAKEEPKAAAPSMKLGSEPMAEKAVPVAERSKATPAVGWAFAGERVDLFGKVGSAAEKQAWVRAAHAAFTGVEVNVDGLRVDAEVASVEADPTTVLRVPTEAEGSAEEGYVALWSSTDEHPTYFEGGVYDSELVSAYPKAELTPEALSLALAPFRSRLLKAGRLELDQPYVSLISDGQTVTLVGEVEGEPTRDAMAAKARAAYEPEMTVEVRVQVSALVEAAADWAAGWETMPSFEKGKAGMAAARPGQPWRPAVVHAIYFKTGTDRSKDQERALYQVRRALAAAPEATFEVVGHTDNTGSAAANAELSLERAQKFVDYLIAAGVAPDRLTSRGAGPDEPIADNATEGGRAQNRRVDVLLK